MPRRLLVALTGLALSLSLVACGSDPAPSGAAAGGGSDTTAKAAGFPVTIDNAAGAVTLDTRPERIVSMSPTATETLFAIGAGRQVVAVDRNSNYPAAAPDGDLDAFNPNVEAIAAEDPDLVVVSNDDGGLVAGLQKLKIPVLLEAAPAALDGAFTQIAELGRATGHEPAATTLVDKMKRGIDGLVSSSAVKGVSYFYELDSTLYSQTSRTFLGQLFARLGLVNVADAAADTTDYPQLSPEFVISADPDLILLADTKCCQQSKATVAARAGWDTMTAVKGDGVVELDDDVASRWGPRLVELLRDVARAATRVKGAR